MKFRAALMIGRFVLFGLLMRATLALAAGNNPPGPPQDGQQRPPGPPREAIEACAGKKAGDAATIKHPDGRSMKANCTLVAVPSEHDRPPMQK